MPRPSPEIHVFERRLFARGPDEIRGQVGSFAMHLWLLILVLLKLLLDTGVCCFCEEGKVSLTAPVCDKCGQGIDPGIVVWG
jgi:hypothetical protein